MPIRWRLTLFIALAIGAILLILGVALFFLLRDALLSNVENTTRQRAENAAGSIREGAPLDREDTEELSLDGVFVIAIAVCNGIEPSLCRGSDGTVIVHHYAAHSRARPMIGGVGQLHRLPP